MQLITRKSVQEIAGLIRPVNRKAAGLFVAEGYKVIGELLGSGLETTQLIVEKGREVPREWAALPVPFFEASAADMAKMSSLSTPAGVLALARLPQYNLPGSIPPGSWLLALDGISDPGNLGTIIRTADWFGINDVICSNHTADCYSPKVVQSAMGSLFRIRVHYTDIKTFIEHACVPFSHPVIVADAAGQPAENADLPSNGLLVIGSESHGVSSQISAAASWRLAIRKHPGSAAESLNAAVACGILMHHLTQK